MNSIFTRINDIQDAWFSEIIGEVNGNPISFRVMNSFAAQFHTHEHTDEMFIVLSGTMYIDTDEGTTKLDTGQAYTIKAGVKHGARAESRAYGYRRPQCITNVWLSVMF